MNNHNNFKNKLACSSNKTFGTKKLKHPKYVWSVWQIDIYTEGNQDTTKM